MSDRQRDVIRNISAAHHTLYTVKQNKECMYLALCIHCSHRLVVQTHCLKTRKDARNSKVTSLAFAVRERTYIRSRSANFKKTEKSSALYYNSEACN